MFIDSHAHLDDKKFSRDLDRALERASNSGVERLVTIGDRAISSRKAVALAHRNAEVYAAVGIHPHNAGDAQSKDFDAIGALADDPRVVAIGEVGLDYHYRHAPPSAQIEAFERQIDLAREVDLPLVVHCREAFDDLLEILRRKKADELGGVVHCFSGDAEAARQLMDLGWYLGIGGAITYPNAQALRETVLAVPAERLVIETDSPYLPPQPKRGRRNEPSYLKFVVQGLAELLGMPFQDVARITKRNTIRLFNLPPEMAPEAAYSLRRSLYLNIANVCKNNCTFCTRHQDFTWAGHNLRLGGEPTREEIWASLENAEDYQEVVFCGVGEPTSRLPLMLEIARTLRDKGQRLRLNTNGQANLICQQDIVPKLAGLFDSMSISLNAATAEEYNRLCRPKDPHQAFASLLDFAKRAKRVIPEIYFSVVGMPGVDIEACRKLAEDELKIPLRIREYLPMPILEEEIQAEGAD